MRAFADAHARTWSLLGDLTPEQWRVPYLPGINPPLWEYGHVAWFTERWLLRGAGSDSAALAPPLLADVDRWFDSMRVAHPERWHLDLPPLDELRDYVAAVLAGVISRLADAGGSDDALYFFRLALFHEDMHGEALTWMRQTLDYPVPAPLALPSLAPSGGEVEIGGRFVMGAAAGSGFAFDNEKWAHEVELPEARIDRQWVSNRAYADFVASGGYRDERWWSGDGLAWLKAAGQTQPQRWRLAPDGAWEQRWFGRWVPLPLDLPVCHVNAYEAEAYCHWAGRRLPSEVEWEFAASRGLIRWGGAVWEWMADPFQPYAGFSPDPYRDYSAPWFHSHRSARGGSFATVARMHHPCYRNFFLPQRNDVFVGFRTCAV